MSYLIGVQVAALTIGAVLGVGANGVVVECVLDVDDDGFWPDVPRRVPLALKVVSHFWDANGLPALANEAAVFAKLPFSDCVVHVYAQFMAVIPDTVTAVLPADMKRVSAATARVSRIVCIIHLIVTSRDPCAILVRRSWLVRLTARSRVDVSAVVQKSPRLAIGLLAWCTPPLSWHVHTRV